jgi:hypothetical protein
MLPKQCRLFRSVVFSPNNKTDRQDIAEILLLEKVDDTNGVSRSCKSKQVKMVLNTKNLSNSTD